MNFKCLLGHDWDGCMCTRCGRTRDEGHDWSKDCEKCTKCGMIRSGAHKWSGSVCSLCGCVGNDSGPTPMQAPMETSNDNETRSMAKFISQYRKKVSEYSGMPLDTIRDDVRERNRSGYGYDCLLGGTFEQVLQYVLRSMKIARRSQGFPVDAIENHRSSQNQLCFETTLSIQETSYGYSKRLHEIWVYRSNQEYDFIAAGYTSDFLPISVPDKSVVPLFELGKLLDMCPDTELVKLFNEASSIEEL